MPSPNRISALEYGPNVHRNGTDHGFHVCRCRKHRSHSGGFLSLRFLFYVIVAAASGTGVIVIGVLRSAPWHHSLFLCCS